MLICDSKYFSGKQNCNIWKTHPPAAVNAARGQPRGITLLYDLPHLKKTFSMKSCLPLETVHIQWLINAVTERAVTVTPIWHISVRPIHFQSSHGVVWGFCWDCIAAQLLLLPNSSSFPSLSQVRVHGHSFISILRAKFHLGACFLWIPICNNLLTQDLFFNTNFYLSKVLQKRSIVVLDSPGNKYRQTLFYFALLYCTSQLLCFLQMTGKTLHQQILLAFPGCLLSRDAVFIALLASSQWPETQTAASPSYACKLLVHFISFLWKHYPPQPMV